MTLWKTKQHIWLYIVCVILAGIVIGRYFDNELIIQVSNFAFPEGGIKTGLHLGQEEAIYKLRARQMGFELFVSGMFLIMALYYFGLYLRRRQDKPAFYAGLFCLLVVIGTTAAGEMMMMEMLPALEGEVLLKIGYLSHYLAVPAGVGFIYHLYASDTSSKIMDTIKAVSMIFSSLVLLLPAKYFLRTLPWYDAFTILACLYVSFILVRALRDKKEGAGLFFLGACILQATVVNDMLFSYGLITSQKMVPLGLCAFILSQTMVLSTRFSRAYASLESATAELRHHNEKIGEYTKMLKEQVRLLDLDPDYTIERSLDGAVSFWNHGAELGYSWTKEEVAGKKIHALLKTKFPQPLPEINAELMRHGRWMGELVQVRKDGCEVVVRSCWLLKRGVDGQPIGVLEISKDITKQKNMEKEMIRLDRLDLIGQLAAGISHEVRNPMTTVRGFLQLLALKEQTARNCEYYELMISELDRANAIITEYLSVARTKSTDLRLQDINTILTSLEPLLKAEALKTGKDIVFNLQEVPGLLLDGGEIRQLVLNLCRNGLEAMSDKGKTLTLSTYVQGEEVILSVRDEGPGIAPEITSRIGMPFLTTKATGTGLGLAVCYGIAARHKAIIDFFTGPEGTTFFVKFNLLH